MTEGQAAGEIATQGGDRKSIKVRVSDLDPESLEDIGVTKQRLAEARTIAGAFTPAGDPQVIARP